MAVFTRSVSFVARKNSLKLGRLELRTQKMVKRFVGLNRWHVLVESRPGMKGGGAAAAAGLR